MKKSVPELQVVLPYSRLLELLEAGEAVEDLRKENRRLNDQVVAIRKMFSECMEVLSDLKEEIRLL